MDKREKENLSLLGNKNTKYPDNYAPEMLETFENKHQENDYFVKFNCPEFTSLCPITGQPDFATIYISYIPDVKMVESKSLKLYLFSFRNHGDFHEDCVNKIMKDLIKLMDPKYIEVWGNLLREAEFQSTLTVITEGLIPNGKNLRKTDCLITICIRKKLTTDKNGVLKHPVFLNLFTEVLIFSLISTLTEVQSL